MSSFTKPLRVEAVDSRTWKLLEEFDYFIGTEDSNEYVSVPKDYETDFATIPQVFWSVIPPWGKYGKAAVIHDFLCSDKYFWRKTENGVEKVECSRKQADDIFLEAVTVLGVDEITRTMMYAAVRAYAIASGKD